MAPRLEYAYATALTLSILQIVIFFTNLECEVEGWGKDISRNISLYVTNEPSQVIPPDFCQKPSTLLIVVSSAPSNVIARQAIRETWGSQEKVSEERISVVFFIGNSLDPSTQDSVLIESKTYQDIILQDFTDSYYNLTIKSFLMLKVTTNKCSEKVKFLLKIDDDMFVNVPKLMKLLLERNNSENVLLGRMMCGTKPIKDPLSKWYCPNYMYNKTFLPNFLSGTGYLMSMMTANKLYRAALNTPFIHLEDVFITGVCAEIAGITPEFDKEFTANALNDEYCQLKDYITMHQFSPERLIRTFRYFQKSELFDCSTYEPMFRASNWMEETLFQPISRSKRKRICQ